MQDISTSVTKPEADTHEPMFQSLRAQDWDEYVGQAQAKKAIQLAINAAKARQDVLDHVLLYGPPGLGKTTLAHIIAHDLGVNIRVTSGPAIERAGDIAAILTNLEPGDIIFIDEIHRLNTTVEETIYPAMEDYKIDVVLGKGPAARTLRLDLPKFTVIGATTQAGRLSAPMRDRFGMTHRLEFYKDHELAQMITKAAQKLNISIDANAALELATRSRKTGRIALKLLKRVRDYAQVEQDGHIDLTAVRAALELLEVDQLGLDASDRRILKTIIEKYQGGPVGLSTIAASAAEDIGTIEDVYEPFLMRIGLISRTKQGRVVTPLAYKHLGLPVK